MTFTCSHEQAERLGRAVRFRTVTISSESPQGTTTSAEFAAFATFLKDAFPRTAAELGWERLSDVSGAVASEEDASRAGMRAAVRWLGVWFLAAIVFILAATRIRAISPYAFPIMGLFFAIACNGAALVAGEKGRVLGSCFLKGILSVAPAIVMILMAMSVKLIITNGGILDTILSAAAGRIQRVGPYAAVAAVYVITLVFEFFIPSASAKAFLIIPILAPLADLVGLTRQTVVFAFDNGDGFANILYPTNPFLMICLGLTVVSYPKWFRWTVPLQAVTVIACLVFMFFAVAVRFGPF